MAICKCGHLIDQSKCLHCLIEEYRQANPQGPTLTQVWPVADEQDVTPACCHDIEFIDAWQVRCRICERTWAQARPVADRDVDAAVARVEDWEAMYVLDSIDVQAARTLVAALAEAQDRADNEGVHNACLRNELAEAQQQIADLTAWFFIPRGGVD